MKYEISGSSVMQMAEAVLHPDNDSPEYIECRRVLTGLQQGNRIHIGWAYKPLLKCEAVKTFVRQHKIYGEHRLFFLGLIAHEAWKQLAVNS